MTGQRRWLKIWARTVGMPIGINDEDKPEFLPIKQTDVKKALAFRTFWVLLHVLTCLLIIASNGRVMNWWYLKKFIKALFVTVKLHVYFDYMDCKVNLLN